MILETLHYLETKHAQRMRKIHITQSFHAMATGTRGVPGKPDIRDDNAAAAAYAAVFAAGDQRVTHHHRKSRDKAWQSGRFILAARAIPSFDPTITAVSPRYLCLEERLAQVALAEKRNLSP
jgi:hypothetical protein